MASCSMVGLAMLEIKAVGFALQVPSNVSLASIAYLFLVISAAIFSGVADAAQADSMTKIESQAAAAGSSSGASAVVYSCYFEGIVRDRATGAAIKGANVTFVKEDKSKAWTATTSDAGRYRRELPEGRYTCIATHSDYIMQSSSTVLEVKAPYTKRVRGAGGIIREITITSERSKVVDIDLSLRPTAVLLVTTTLLSRTEELDDAVSRYAEVVRRKDGLAADYVVLDSEDCRSRFGVRLGDPGDWEEIRGVLQAITGRTGPCYIILLGGSAVLPVPAVVSMDGSFWYLPSDGWYIDFNGDGIVDEGFAVSRLPDTSTDCAAVIAGLQTASDIHEAGGFGMIPEMRLSTQCWYPPPIGLGDACADDAPICGLCYATPPYGVCEECDKSAELFDLISESDYIFFMGHGSPTSFSTNDRVDIFNLENVADVDLQDKHPLINGYVSCNTGLLYDDRGSFATEFLRAGAAAFIARTTDKGTPNYFADHFEAYLKGSSASGRYRAGDALSELMRESVLRRSDDMRREAMQLCMYGDPTLERTRFELPAFSATTVAGIGLTQR